MVNSIQKEKPSLLYNTLVWASVILQGIGAFLLACGAILTIIFFIRKIDNFNWTVILLCGAILSANLGLMCLILAGKQISEKRLVQNVSMPVSQKSGFGRSAPCAAVTSESVPDTTAPEIFVSALEKHRRPGLKIAR
jgi:hypothetical protein